MKQAGIELDREIQADLAVQNQAAFDKLLELAAAQAAG